MGGLGQKCDWLTWSKNARKVERVVDILVGQAGSILSAASVEA
jgi:hypothetical protein